jgi:glycosyltransferase involved in cell wall biosynthesis
MNIAISTTTANGLTDGVGQYLHGLFSYMPALGNQHRFTVFSTQGDEQIISPSPNIQFVELPTYVRRPTNNIAWHAAVYGRLLRRHQIDLVHIPDLRRFLLDHPVPTIVTIHDMARYRLPRKYDRLRMFYHRVIQPLFLRQFKQVITVSENTRLDIEHFFPFLADRITVIHNGVNTFHYRVLPSEQVDEVRRRMGLPKQFILYVARLEHPAKNHVRLIEAFRGLKLRYNLSHKLVLAGAPSFRHEEIYKVAHTLGEEVVFTGFVAKEDLPALYNAASLSVFPSLYEGFGLPIVEAMACGVPIAASNISSIPEIAGNAAVYFDPERTQEIESAMYSILADEYRQNTLRELGLARVPSFSWKKAAQETLNIYEQVIAMQTTEGQGY